MWEETSEGHMSESLPLFSHCLAPAEAPLAVPSLLSGVNKTSTHYWAAFQLSNTALLPRLQPPESAENAFMHAPSRPSAERVGFWGFLLNGIFFWRAFARFQLTLSARRRHAHTAPHAACGPRCGAPVKARQGTYLICKWTTQKKTHKHRCVCSQQGVICNWKGVLNRQRLVKMLP